eukprot:4146057-Pyramimonas_sp.AAC.1
MERRGIGPDGRLGTSQARENEAYSGPVRRRWKNEVEQRKETGPELDKRGGAAGAQSISLGQNAWMSWSGRAVRPTLVRKMGPAMSREKEEQRDDE